MNRGEIKLKIGIDIDGVIVDTINFTAHEISKHYGFEISADAIAHGTGEVEGLTEYFIENGEYLLSAVAPRENAATVINELAKENEVYLISARYYMHYNTTIKWLEKYDIRVNEVIFTEGKSKIDVCKKIGVEMFIEDSIENAVEIVDLGIPVYLYRTDYNKELNKEGITHCESWTDILECINKNRIIA